MSPCRQEGRQFVADKCSLHCRWMYQLKVMEFSDITKSNVRLHVAYNVYHKNFFRILLSYELQKLHPIAALASLPMKSEIIDKCLLTCSTSTDMYISVNYLQARYDFVFFFSTPFLEYTPKGFLSNSTARERQKVKQPALSKRLSLHVLDPMQHLVCQEQWRVWSSIKGSLTDISRKFRLIRFDNFKLFCSLLF